MRVSKNLTLKNKALLEGLAYSSQLKCASVSGLVSKLSPHFKGTFKHERDFTEKIDGLIRSFPKREGLIGEKKALEILLAWDLEKIKRTLSVVNLRNPAEALHSNLKTYKKVLNGHGIDLETRIFIVDSFPPPYTDPSITALNCDADDEKEFNIKPGIYFKRTDLVPLLSSSLLAHELVHVCFSKVRTGRLARGLEDGLCDLMGIYLSSKTLGFGAARNMLLNQTLSYPSSQSGQIYVDALRQAIRIYQIYGLKGLFQILRLGNQKGRIIIKQIEEKCIRGRYSDLGLDKGDWTAKLNDFSDYFTGFPTSIVASPLACYLAERIKAGDSVKEVIQKHGIDPRDGRRAVRQLEEDLYLIVTANGRIVYDETKAYVKTGTLRYAIKKS